MKLFLPSGILLGAALAVASAQNYPGASKLPDPYFNAPVGVQLKTDSFTIPVLDEIHAMGFRAFRRGIYWDAVEKQKGVYDFSAYDKEFAHAKELGLRVVGAFFGNNPLHEDDKRGGIQTEAGRKGFAAFAAATAAHFKDHDIIWEVWNEPNVRTFWRKDGMHNSEEFAEEYTSLVKEVAAAVLKADPGACISAGSVSNYWKPSYEWTEFCFKKGILKSGISAWSVHPYGVKAPEQFAEGHQITRNLLKKYGAPDMPMIDTERGFAIAEHQGGGEVANEGFSGGAKDRVLEYQAWHFVRQYMADQMHGLRLTIWYEWGGDEFGLLKNRPVHQAAVTMMKELDGYKFIERLPSDSALDYILLFENKAGARKLVAWTSPPAGASPDETPNHSVTVDGTGGGSFAVVDLLGKSSQVQGSPLKLDLTGAPQYVTLPAGTKPGGSKIVPGTMQAPKTAAPVSSAAAVGGKNLGLFAPNNAWQFIKNTGEGSMTNAKDGGTEIGILAFDFTAAKTQAVPYVLAMTPVEIPAGTRVLHLSARGGHPQRLTIRLVDDTGQTLQFKGRISGLGEWEAVTIPLDRKFEHWEGANDGKVHFPIKKIMISLPQNDDLAKSGKVEFANAIIE